MSGHLVVNRRNNPRSVSRPAHSFLARDFPAATISSMRAFRYLTVPFLLAAAAVAAEPTSEADAAMLRRIYDAALTDSPAYANLSELVAKYPGRITGSKALEGAVLWGKSVLEKQGVDRTELQPVMVPHWERGAPESVRIAGSNTPLTATALGGSVATPAGGLKAGVIELHALDELKTADVKGKIVFFNRPMRPQDIEPLTSYGGAGDQRNRGPAEAAKYGAVGVLTRSLTHALDDVPHTGNTSYADGVPRIPAAALSTLAANRLSAALQSDPALQVEIVIHAQWFDPAPSHNVIGEIRGSEFPDQVILVGGHLDSWDITPGAHDDGAGIVQSIDVLRILQATGYKPRHTIRCVLFVSEENGGSGGKEYARVAAEKKERHLLAYESDGGGGQPYALQFGNAAGTAFERASRFLPLFAPYNIGRFTNGLGGSDVGHLKDQGVVLGQIQPMSQRYFDLHHTAVDTIDKVNPRELQLGAAAMASVVYLFDQHEL